MATDCGQGVAATIHGFTAAWGASACAHLESPVKRYDWGERTRWPTARSKQVSNLAVGKNARGQAENAERFLGSESWEGF